MRQTVILVRVLPASGLQSARCWPVSPFAFSRKICSTGEIMAQTHISNSYTAFSPASAALAGFAVSGFAALRLLPLGCRA